MRRRGAPAPIGMAMTGTLVLHGVAGLLLFGTPSAH